MTSKQPVLLYAVGDIGLDREDTDEPFDLVRDTLQAADIVFGQVELPLTEGGTRLPQARHTVRGPLSTAPSLKRAGFSMISLAGNHCMDWGREAMLETADRLEAEGMTTVGVGIDIAAARTPKVAEVNGHRVAFLAYSSILPMSYWADERRAGCAPMRAWTIYEQVEHDQPGTPARIHTYPNRDDLKRLRADIARAKEMADHVVVSLHWGIHFVPAVIADYQQDVAYAAIDAGAEVILGHHAHILKGIEIYKGKPIFYSLSNFAMDAPMDAAMIASRAFREIQTLNPNWNPSPERRFNFPEDSRKTIVVKATIDANSIWSVSFLPAFVNLDDRPEILAASDLRHHDVVEYIRQITEQADLKTEFQVRGDEVFMAAAS